MNVSRNRKTIRRLLSALVTGAVLAVGLVAAPAMADGPGTTNGTSMARPSATQGASTGSISASGCGATTKAKWDRAQTFFSDQSPSDSRLVCMYVKARVMFVSGTSVTFSAWDKDDDSAQVLSSTYTASNHQLVVISAV